MRLKRHKNLISAVLVSTLILHTCMPVSAGEIEESAEPYGAVEDYVENDQGISEGEQDTKTSSYQNVWCGTIFVMDDGLYSQPDGSEKLTVSGVSYEPSTHTLTLDNVSIGCVYDDILRHDKIGSIVFAGENKGKGKGYESYPDFTVNLIGHNYLGGFSTFERKHCFWADKVLEIKNEPNKYYRIGAPMQNLMGYKHWSMPGRYYYADKGAHSVIFTGEGDITINGSLRDSVSIDTAKTIWYSGDDEGTNIVSIKKAEFLERHPDYWHSFDYYLYYRFKDDDWKAYSFNGECPGFVGRSSERDGVKYDNSHSYITYIHYYKIGGDKPDTPNRPAYVKEKVVDLGVIGGHTVSVCHTDNVSYQGRKLINRSLEGEYFTESNTEARALWISVYVDGKRYEVRDKRSLQGGAEKEDDSVFSVRTRYMNNKDVSTQKKGKTVSPCFAFSFTNQSKLDKAFIKAINDYFKNKDNWIKFNIVPLDIKYAETTFLGTTGYHPKNLSPTYPKKDKYEAARSKYIKRNIVIQGDNIKKIQLVGPRLNGSGSKEKLISKKLRWDKKYTEGKIDPKADFRAEISGNYIVITGENNYTGTVIVNNPLVKEDEFFYNYNNRESYASYPGTMYFYRNPKQ